MTAQPAILLLGPTGSGKTPLGDLLSDRGLWGRPCAHFDFGRELRRTVDGGPPAGLDAKDVVFIRNVLESGALLEDEHFYIARSLLQNFIARCDLADGRLVLNGLPRHAGQARDVGALVDVQTVVELHCSAETVYERIAADTGGDRGGRTDDDPAAIVRKLEIYRARIEPLIEYYRIRSARVETVDVATTSSAESTLAELESRCGGE